MCSIRRNICYGLEEEDGLGPEEVPSMADVEEAARLANAHDFIMTLPKGYETVSHALILGQEPTHHVGTRFAAHKIRCAKIE